MIWTKYNYIFKSEKFGVLLYNSLTNTFVNIGDDIYDIIVQIKSDPQHFDFSDTLRLRDVLMKMCVIYDGTNEDIENQLKLESCLNKYNTDCRNLTIIPTLDCNFRCAYCYEKDRIKPVYMDDETENKIIEFIGKNHRKTESLNIEWFGGEPLLAFNRIVSLTGRIKKLGIDFESGLTTNGFLLTTDKIDFLKELGISKIQITIDGTEETHNKRRPHRDNKETYSTILKNIEDIIKYSNSNNYKIALNIRVNIDDENKGEYSSIREELKHRFPTAYVYPGIVLGEESTNKCNSSPCVLDRRGLTQFYFEQYLDSQNDDLNYFPSRSGTLNCYATRLNDYTIGPRGEIYSCLRDVGNDEMLRGNIHDNDVITNWTVFSRFFVGVDPFEDEKCRACFYLPICGGGCPYDRVLNKYHNQAIDTCTMHKGSAVLEKMLEIHYEIKLRSLNNKLEVITFPIGTSPDTK